VLRFLCAVAFLLPFISPCGISTVLFLCLL
jgi:hypothetical protein